MHQIWVIIDKNGKIECCWEAPDAPDPENPDAPPIEVPNMPADWHRLRISEPDNFEEIKKAAKEKKKTISHVIFKDYEVDVENKKLKERIYD